MFMISLSGDKGRGVPKSHGISGHFFMLMSFDVVPNTYQKINDTHTCLNFSETCQNVCLYSTDSKASVNLVY